MRPIPLLGSALLLLVAYVVRSLLYAVLLRRLDSAVPMIAAIQIFFGSQAGRYAPGKVWQIAGAGVLGRLRGGSATAAAWSSAIVVLTHHLAGAAVGLLVVGQLSNAAGWGVAAALGAGTLALAFIVSPLFPKVLGRLGSALGRELPELPVLPTRLMAASAPFFFGIWMLFGVALWLFCMGTLSEVSRLTVVDGIGIMAASCVAGYVVLVAPSGIGVREATMALLLSPILDPGEAGLVALGMRLWMTLIEAPLIAWGLGARSG